jgi:hypothetical protein
MPSRVLWHGIEDIWPSSPETAAMLLEYSERNDPEIQQTAIEYLHSLGPQPIETAPVKPGEVFQCLLLDPEECGTGSYVSDRGGWITGRWNGEGWICDDGLPRRPTHRAQLPAAPVDGSAAQ